LAKPSGQTARRSFHARDHHNKPDILFMDEASSALDNATEAAMYQLIADRLPDSTVVSIDHRTTLESFHDRRLNLGAAGAAAEA
jgi:putative ATP-binding cassette transporter